MDATRIRLNSLSFHPLFASPFRRFPGGTHLLPHEGLEIIEERLHGREDLQGVVGKVWLQHSLIVERMDDQELLVAQQLDLGMVGGVSSRRCFEHFPGDAVKIFPKSRRFDHLFHGAGILDNGGADGLQVSGGGHVRAARQNRSAGHDVDVVGQPQRVPAAGSQNG